jgi:hypothetical protein
VSWLVKKNCEGHKSVERMVPKEDKKNGNENDKRNKSDMKKLMKSAN